MALDKPLESSSLHGLNYMLTEDGQLWFIDLTTIFWKTIFLQQKASNCLLHLLGQIHGYP